MPYRERGYFVRDFTGGETSTTMLLRVRRWIGQMFPVLQGKMDIGRYNEMRPAMYERLLQSVDRVQGFDGLRNIHVGIDIGAAVGTPIRSFFDGRVYKFGFNPSPGDYGHVIVTEHNINGHRVWALYGHLSAKSMFAPEEVACRATESLPGVACTRARKFALETSSLSWEGATRMEVGRPICTSNSPYNSQRSALPDPFLDFDADAVDPRYARSGCEERSRRGSSALPRPSAGRELASGRVC
mmetsp:Transcript_36803/g.115086  ORF Transcript_36803/g.115086 Transcript_36803/m.115086 type:complete len:242 (+) Transcript_36803:429-1154(+)